MPELQLKIKSITPKGEDKKLIVLSIEPDLAVITVDNNSVIGWGVGDVIKVILIK